MNQTINVFLLVVCSQSASAETPVVSPIRGVVKEVVVRAGDRVTKGQVLIRLDDRQARLHLERLAMETAKLAAQSAAADAAGLESRVRHERAIDLFKKAAMSKVDLAGAQLMHSKFLAEAAAAWTALEDARFIQKRHQLYVDQHEIRAPTAGVVRAILRRTGDAVKTGDSLMVLEPSVED
jgi:multidrug resistance efflux pump